MAKKDVEAIVSGGGLFLAIMTDLVSAIKEEGGTSEDIHRLSTPQGRKTLREMAKLAVPDLGEVYPITIDLSQTLADMITSGHYDWVRMNAYTTPTKRRGIVETGVILVRVGRSIKSRDALSEIDQRGLRPGAQEHLLAFGAQYPDKQKEFPIVALDSEWWGPGWDNRAVPVLRSSADGRGVDLEGWNSVWDERCRFLALRK